MTVLTASSGTVSLTSATGWSPSQVPAAGDDLVVVAATLNLDADMIGANALGSITFNNASSRLSFAGINRSVACLNGFSINANIGASLIGTAIPAGSTLTLEGKLTFGSLLVSPSFAFASLNGGTLNLRTNGSVASDVLAETSGNSAFRILSGSSSGTLNTVGRFSFGSTVQQNVVNVAGANWNHTSAGLNTIGPSPISAFSISGSSRVSWTGSVDSQSTVASGTFLFASSDTGSTIGQAGDTFCARGSGSSTNPPTSLLRASGTGTVELAGKWVAKNRAATLDLAGSTVRYRNQSSSIASDEHLTAVVAGGTLDVSGLEIANAGKVVIAELAAAAVTANAQTLITNQSTAAQAASNSTALSGRIITLESNPPTLPGAEYVSPEAGTWGYTEDPQTGTGLVIDPAVLAAAIAHLPTLEEIQENAVFVLPISYQQQSQLQGAWIRRAIGDASPMELRGLKDANGAAINLSGKTLKLYVTTSGKTPTVVQTFNHADLTVFGDNDSVRFTPSTTLVGTVRKLLLSLRVVTTTEQEIVPGGIDIYRTAWTS